MRKALFNLGIVCLFVLALVSCSRDAGDGQAVVAESAAEVQAAIAQAEAQVIAAADTYIEAWFWHFPEMATLYRIEGKSHDRLADNTRAGRAAWQAQEDKLLADLSAVDPALLEGTAAWLPYGVLLESLEASRNSRVCQDHSWNIDQVWGWQIFFGELATAQPVSTEEERAWALARWRQIPVFIDGEIENLTDGLASGFSAPRRNVSLVVEQLDSLLDMAPHESPFFGPARTADLEEFSAELEVLIAGEIYPAMQRYRDFLVDEYHDKARTEIAVAALPDGDKCYTAKLRAFTTLPYGPEEMFAAGNEAVELREGQIAVVGERVFETSDLAEIRVLMKSDEPNPFASRDEVLEYTTAAVNRAREAAPRWFGRLPQADVIITPVPEYQEQSSSARYVPASDDGELPGTYYINLFQPESQSRGSIESVAFHETYPGHHLQVALAQERSEAHPITRYIFNSGFSEGWARYSETLANEMGLYSSDRNTLAMLSGLPTGMVVDPGIHAMGWSREEAIDYTLSKQVDMTPEEAGSYVDRIVVWPGQMVTYGAGELEFIRLRRQAEAALGDDFDIREFHDQALGNGSITLIMLREHIAEWLASDDKADAD
jgi:uncharacterized protein (DUF885 family)